MSYLSPRPNHRDRIPYFVYLLDKSLADYLAGEISLGMLAGDIEGFAETVGNCFGGRFDWQAVLDNLYGTVSLRYFNDETFSEEQLESIRRAIVYLRTELARWWAENNHAAD